MYIIYIYIYIYIHNIIHCEIFMLLCLIQKKNTKQRNLLLKKNNDFFIFGL